MRTLTHQSFLVSLTATLSVLALLAGHTHAAESLVESAAQASQRAQDFLLAKDFGNAASIVEQYVPEVDKSEPSSEWPVAEDEFGKWLQLVTSIVREGMLPRDRVSRIYFAQMYGYRRAMLLAQDPTKKSMRYDQWRGLRLKYLLVVLLYKSQWNAAEDFIAQGVQQGLEPLDSSRERFARYEAEARSSQHEDVLREYENREWIRAMKDRIDSAKEKGRLQEILDADDPVVREKEAAIIRSLFNGRSAGRAIQQQHDRLFEKATEEVRAEFKMAVSETDRERVANDAVSLALLAEHLYRWPPDDFPPQLTMALSLKSQITDPLQRLAMDSVYAIARARRGSLAEGATLQKQVESSANQTGKAMSRKWQRRVLLTNAKLKELEPSPQHIHLPEKTEASQLLQGAARAVAPSASSTNRSEMYARVVLATTKDIVLTSNDPGKVRHAIEAAGLVYVKLRKPWLAMDVLQALEKSLGANAPSSTLAELSLVRMWVLSAQAKYGEAVQVADQMAKTFLHSTDQQTVDICADALCHAYLYKAYYLKDPSQALIYTTMLQQSFPDGRYSSLMRRFEGMLNELQTKRPLTAYPSH